MRVVAHSAGLFGRLIRGIGRDPFAQMEPRAQVRDHASPSPSSGSSRTARASSPRSRLFSSWAAGSSCSVASSSSGRAATMSGAVPGQLGQQLPARPVVPDQERQAGRPGAFDAAEPSGCLVEARDGTSRSHRGRRRPPRAAGGPRRGAPRSSDASHLREVEEGGQRRCGRLIGLGMPALHVGAESADLHDRRLQAGEHVPPSHRVTIDRRARHRLVAREQAARLPTRPR